MSLVNMVQVPVGDVDAMLALGFTVIEIWRSEEWNNVAEEVTSVDTRIPLVSGTTLYTFRDLAGTDASRYKWRLSAGGSAPFSKYSQYADGKSDPVSGIPLSVAVARFVEVDGRPKKTRVIVAIESTVRSGQYTIRDQGFNVFESDEDGLLQVPLVQGARVRVAIEGTAVVKLITVPATASFDLMQAMGDAPDGFDVQTTPPLLTRRNL